LSWILKRGSKLRKSEKSDQEEMMVMMMPSYNQPAREQFKDQRMLNFDGFSASTF
jgi:hypothetical protein